MKTAHQIRKMVKSDAAAYRELRLRALKNNPEAFGSAYEDTVERDVEAFRERIPEPDSDDVIFVAENDGELCGLAVFIRDSYRKTRHKSNIYSVYVDEHVRGQGVGRALLEAIITHAGQLEGLQQIRIAVNASNTPALELYQSLGFQIWGTEPVALYVNGTYYDEHYMLLDLDSR